MGPLEVYESEDLTIRLTEDGTLSLNYSDRGLLRAVVMFLPRLSATIRENTGCYSHDELVMLLDVLASGIEAVESTYPATDEN